MKKTAFVILFLSFFSFFCIALADASKYEVTDGDKIYYGNCRDFSRPACLSIKTVFREIPQYRVILRNRLTRRDSDYWLLLNAANEVFRNVVNNLASEYKYDLICEHGYVKPKSQEDTVTDITHLALLHIRKLPEK